MKTSDLIIGLGLVVLGFIFLSENFGFIKFDFRDIWPLIIVLGGLGFWFGFLKDRNNYGLIMPGTILIIYGLLFWYINIITHCFIVLHFNLHKVKHLRVVDVVY